MCNKQFVENFFCDPLDHKKFKWQGGRGRGNKAGRGGKGGRGGRSDRGGRGGGREYCLFVFKDLSPA